MRYSTVSIRQVLHWLIALAAIYALASIATLLLSKQISNLISALPLVYFGEFIALITLSFFIRSMRWGYLCNKLIPGMHWRHAVTIYIGGFPMTLTPGRIGEVWRAWVINKYYNSGYRRALPLIVCDRLLDLNALLLFAILGVFTAAAAYQLPAAAAVLVMLPLLLLLMMPRTCRRFIKLFYSILGNNWQRQFAALLAICRHIAKVVHPAIYLPAFVLSLVAWGIEAYAIYTITMRLDGILSLSAAMATLGLGNIAGVLTFLPGGIGGQEAVMIYLLQQGGNTLALAALVTGIARIATIFYAALLGIPFFIHHTRYTPPSSS